jgi:hypothetical protein
MEESLGTHSWRPDDWPKRLAKEPDLVVLVAWWLLVATIGFSRRDFGGDGLRHLPWILHNSTPHLGEPRWLLFPLFLFGLLRPLVTLGLVTTLEELNRPMMLATLVAAGAYLTAVRACLIGLGIGPTRRATALLLAGASSGLFLAATDLVEPIFGGALAVMGLAHIAGHSHASDSDPKERRRAVLVGIAMITAAALLYQGVILAVGLVPIFVSRATLWHWPTFIAVVALLVAFPILITAILVADGNSLHRALIRMFFLVDNPLYRNYGTKLGLTKYLVAAVGGPPQGLFALTEFRGFNGLLAELRASEGRREALRTAAKFFLGDIALVAAVVAAARRRDFALLLGLATLLAMPVLLRPAQFGYIKYYILFPLVVAVAAARAPTRIALPLGLVILLSNFGTIVQGVRAERRTYAIREAVYARASPRSCWLTTGWGPVVSFRWPGKVCGILGTLAGGAGEDVDQLLHDVRATLTDCIDNCFCHSANVFTDDMLADSAALVTENARYFQYSTIDLLSILIPASRAPRVTSAAEPRPIYTYASEDQQRICASVEAQRQSSESPHRP